MHNHYKILGLSNAATAQEVRRAYRILARRYHPDLSSDPGSADKFKLIADAHHVLSDPTRRAHYDLELEGTLKREQSGRSGTYTRSGTKTERPSATERYKKTQAEGENRAQRRPPDGPPPPPPRTSASQTTAPSWSSRLKDLSATLRKTFQRERGSVGSEEVSATRVTKISIIEASITVLDAINGVKKTVEIEEPAGTRKLSVAIPPGVRSGSVIRLRAKNSPTEELVLIVRVASHPFIAMQPRGIVVEVPVSVQEAVFGASITVPTLEDPVSIKIPPGTQSGQEVRLRERGVHHREGARGDIFYRILIAVPGSPEAVGLREKVGELEAYYGGGVRAGLPAALAG